MIKSSIFAIQLQNELLGSNLKIFSLKQELERRLALTEPEVVLRWNGQETVLKLSARK
jgi:hypothetical protein